MTPVLKKWTRRPRWTFAVIAFVLAERSRGVMLRFERMTGQPRLTAALCVAVAAWAVGCCVTAGVAIPLGGTNRLIAMVESGAISLGNDFFRSEFLAWVVPKTDGFVFHWWWMPSVKWWPAGELYAVWERNCWYLDVPLYPVVVVLGLIIAVRRRSLLVPRSPALHR
jgi:hypothetical protein